MCSYGTHTEVLCWQPPHLTWDGIERLTPTKVDSCIAPIVAALNLAGIRTTQSCCGHGKGPGRIDLWDGRVLIVHPDTNTAPLEPRPAIAPDGEATP